MKWVFMTVPWCPRGALGPWVRAWRTADHVRHTPCRPGPPPGPRSRLASVPSADATERGVHTSPFKQNERGPLGLCHLPLPPSFLPRQAPAAVTKCGLPWGVGLSRGATGSRLRSQPRQTARPGPRLRQEARPPHPLPSPSLSLPEILSRAKCSGESGRKGPQLMDFPRWGS